MTFEFIDLVLAFLLGSAVSFALISWLAQRWFNRLREALEQAMEEAEPSVADRIQAGDVIPLNIEVDNDQYLCYNANTQEFVCQGTNIHEIIERFRSRFPGLNAVIYSGNEQAVATLKQQLKEHRESSSSIRSPS